MDGIRASCNDIETISAEISSKAWDHLFKALPNNSLKLRPHEAKERAEKCLTTVLSLAEELKREIVRFSTLISSIEAIPLDPKVILQSPRHMTVEQCEFELWKRSDRGRAILMPLHY